MYHDIITSNYKQYVIKNKNIKNDINDWYYDILQYHTSLGCM